MTTPAPIINNNVSQTDLMYFKEEILGNINSNVGTTNNSNNSKQIKATAEEVAIAKAAGMSIEDYLAIKGMDNVKEYEQYSKGKK